MLVPPFLIFKQNQAAHHSNPCLSVQSSSSIICFISVLFANFSPYFTISLQLIHPPGALEARIKARGAGGPAGCEVGLAGQWLVVNLTWWAWGWPLQQTWELIGIRWPLTSVPIFSDFPPRALGNVISAQFPGPQRKAKARFHRRLRTSPRESLLGLNVRIP